MSTKWVPAEVPELGTHHVIVGSCTQNLEVSYIGQTEIPIEQNTVIGERSSQKRSKTSYRHRHG